jgi:hypothetical protein
MGINVDEDSEVQIALDVDGGEFEEGQQTYFTIVDAPQHGGLSYDEFAGLVYKPDENYDGDDSFTYYVTDDDTEGPTFALDSDIATVTIGINPINDAPVAVDDAETTSEDTAVTIDVLDDDFDIDSSTITVVAAGGWAIDGGPTNGGSVSFSATGVTYTPPEDWNGTEDLWYTISDGELFATAFITVQVTPVNDAPVLDDNSNWFGPVDSTNPSWADQVLNGEDVDGDAWFITSVGPANAGTVTGSGQAFSYEYTDFSFDGYDSFSVTISDGHGGTATGTVVMECWGDELALKASGTPTGTAADLGSTDLTGIVAAARARLQAAGADTSGLNGVEFRVTNLSGADLARVVSSVVLIDGNAAGFGWFVDATPQDDLEFGQVSETEFHAKQSSDSAGRMDLLTAIMHEMGHLLGQEHTATGLMANTLDAGVRKIPDSDLAWAAMAADDLFSNEEELDDALLSAY